MSGFGGVKSGATKIAFAFLIFTAITTVSCSSKNAKAETGTQQPLATVTSSLVNQLSLEEALKNGKPTLADFGSNNCAPCRYMKEVLDEVAAEYDGRLNVVIIDVYGDMQRTREYGIMSIPTQILFDRDGKLIARNIGIIEKEGIVAALEKYGVLNE